MTELDRLIQLLAKLPGMGPRSARRAALKLVRRREAMLLPLLQALTDTAEKVRACSVCGNFDSADPCSLCRDDDRDNGTICIVEDVASLWALERTRSYHGRYHVLGGVLSALDGIGPEDLGIDRLADRARDPRVTEVILALGATVDGQTTAHYIADRLAGCAVTLSRLGHGVPVGGELDYLDDGTIAAALKNRRVL
jgi:recombination protein RecR